MMGWRVAEWLTRPGFFWVAWDGWLVWGRWVPRRLVIGSISLDCLGLCWGDRPAG